MGIRPGLCRMMILLRDRGTAVKELTLSYHNMATG